MLNLSNKRRSFAYIQGMSKRILPSIDAYYQTLQALSDSELAAASSNLRVEAAAPGDMELRFQAFALVKEAVRRETGLVLYDVQLLGGWTLCDGHIAEMKTGEGKTVVSLLPAYWFALQGKGVHIITVNAYLAKRDYVHMALVFKWLDVTVGLNLPESTLHEKKIAYQQEVTFGTSSEFGFDYLRDHLAYNSDQRVMRGLAYAIIDEVDSILIDESRTPLIIAGKTKAAPDLYWICARFINGLKENRDYEVDLQTKQVMFTSSAITRIEAAFQIDNLYALEHTSIYQHLLQSLRANVLFQRDVDYMVVANKVSIIDSFTGRVLDGRQYGEGLHQAIEAKEQVPLSEEIRTQAAITLQKYFSLYDTLIGMTGTAKTEEVEIKRIYGLDVIEIPTFKPIVREDYPDLILLTKLDKYAAVVEEIIKCQSMGRPVLIGTTSVQQSEKIAFKLAERGIAYQILNAKTEAEEAEIIARAGQLGAITIATNMAGRGTDIRLGDDVAALGGLHVIATERHESRRVDNQLRGRAGRQGDPGSSQFILSLEDELFTRFAADEIEQYIDQRVAPESKQLQVIAERAQRRVESQMYDIRTMVYQMDSIIHEQRQAFYEQRNAIVLQEVDLMDVLSDYIDIALNARVNEYCAKNLIFEEWNLPGLVSSMHMNTDDLAELRHMTETQKMLEKVHAWWNTCCDEFIGVKAEGMDRWISHWRLQLLQLMDRFWQLHLDQVELIKQGIHYQAYAQRNPILAYEQETWERFADMGHQIQDKVSQLLIQEIAEWREGIIPEQTNKAELHRRIS